MDRMLLKRMVFYGYHGVFPEENRLGQKYYRRSGSAHGSSPRGADGRRGRYGELCGNSRAGQRDCRRAAR